MAVILNIEQVMPPTGSAILVNTRPNTIYEDGKPTDRTDGIRCDIRVLPDLAPVSVKVPGGRAPLSNEDIEADALTGKLTWVSFEGFKGTQWLDRRTNQLRVSGSATAIRVCSAPDNEFDIE